MDDSRCSAVRKPEAMSSPSPRSAAERSHTTFSAGLALGPALAVDEKPADSALAASQVSNAWRS
ncbi:MAG TPA: hypothetical protein VJ376_04075, partial [Pseudomonadota bacterium]|nr:hypothetical protein [Pseudomonadota bacterium]